LGITVLFGPIALFIVLLQRTQLAVAALVSLFTVMFSHMAIERLAPRTRPEPMPIVEHLRNHWHGMAYGLGLGAATVFASHWLMGSLAGALAVPRWTGESTVTNVAVVLVLGDFLDYWRHRFEHRSDGVFWRLHAVHHSITRMSSMRGARVHPTEPMLVYGCYGLVGGLLGIDLRATFIAAVLAILVMTTQHLDFEADIGWLRYLVVFNDTHRWHHDRFRTPACNYANVLTVWDLLFGTYHQPHAFDGPVGIEPIADRFPSSLLEQATLPFRPERWQKLVDLADQAKRG
jgi:sterol desaturase/sphingolipid hydroxylase (fatty acid hydroxylase superfamily)